MEESKKENKLLKAFYSKKILIPILFILLLFLLSVIAIKVINNKHSKSYIENTINELYETYLNDIESGRFNSSNDDSDNIYYATNKHAAIVTVSSGFDKAKVIYDINTNEEDAINKVIELTKEYVESNNINVKALKLDIAYDFENKTIIDLQNEITNYNEYCFNKGIIFKNTLLLPAELDVNEIINYTTATSNKVINMSNLNTYLKYRGNEKLSALPSICYTFKVHGYFKKDGHIYKMADDDISYYNREIDNLEEESKRVIKNNTNILYSLIQNDGSFDYCNDIRTGKDVSETYNVLRHCGSMMSLIRNYDLINAKEKDKKEKIKLALNYIKDNYFITNSTYYLVADYEGDEVCLGGNALCALAFMEYCDKIEKDKVIYLDAIKLIQGIMECSYDDGKLNHLYYLNLELKKSFSSEYYDGEAQFALYMAYELTGDEAYLDRALKMTDYFIDNYGVSDYNHWMGYNLNYATKYSDDVKYYNYLSDILDGKLAYYTRRNHTTYSTNEFLQNIDNIYDRMIEKNIDSKLKKYKKEDLDKIQNERERYMLSTAANDEISMYFASRDFNGAYIQRPDYTLRVDDIQHTLMSMNNFLNDEY